MTFVARAAHGNWVFCLSLSPAEDLLYSGGESLKVWDISGAKKVRVCPSVRRPTAHRTAQGKVKVNATVAEPHETPSVQVCTAPRRRCIHHARGHRALPCRTTNAISSPRRWTDLSGSVPRARKRRIFVLDSRGVRADLGPAAQERL